MRPSAATASGCGVRSNGPNASCNFEASEAKGSQELVERLVQLSEEPAEQAGDLISGGEATSTFG
jgi:hypothetical protein